jgi:starch synthase
VYLKDKYAKFKFFSKTKILFTIHNLQYQGVFGGEILGAVGLDGGYYSPDKFEYYNKINFMKAGILYADMINSVSETYAKEIQSPEFGYGLDGILRSRSADLVGILNGIDTIANDPETDKYIYKNYSAADFSGKFDNKEALQKELGLPVSGAPLIGIVSRLATQKGFDIMQGMFEGLMSKNVQVVLLGTGEYNFEEFFKHYAWRFPKKLSANIRFSAELAQKIYAGSDMFLMPSLFEPCGLGQMFAMRYGSIPIGRKTGGLKDTIAHYHTTERPDGNGFLFEDYIPSGLSWALDEAIYYYGKKDEWFKIVRNAMTKDFSWSKSADKYIKTYEKLYKR